MCTYYSSEDCTHCQLADYIIRIGVVS